MFAIVLLALTGALVFSHMSPFPALLEAFRPSKAVWRMPVPPGTRHVYLTFDDGPNLEWTPRVLDALREQGAIATFFLIDEHVTPETGWVVQRIVREGHAIGLHSGTRRLMVLDPEDLAARLEAAADRIAAIGGRRPCPFFRPHAGWRSATMYEALARLDYRLAGWSWGMWDWQWWRTPNAAALARKLERKADPGDIIVIHDGHHRDPAADRSHAAATVRLLVPTLRAKGFSFEPLCGG
jgi:peptidoglycan/xylan/chitin deacetylase (PgdA/CDA1 family)